MALSQKGVAEGTILYVHRGDKVSLQFLIKSAEFFPGVQTTCLHMVDLQRYLELVIQPHLRSFLGWEMKCHVSQVQNIFVTGLDLHRTQKSRAERL